MYNIFCYKDSGNKLNCRIRLVHENYQAKQKTKEQWLIPCWVPRVWSESGPVFKVCVLPWFLTQSKSSPTEGLLQLHKSVSKSQVPAMFEDRLISYILWTQNFGFKQKINYLGVVFLMFFFGCSLLLSADYKTSFLTDLNYMLLDWMTRRQLLCLLES